MGQLKSTLITGNLAVTGEIVEQGEKIKDKYALRTYVDSLTGEDIYTDSNETSTIKAALDTLGSSITKKLDSTTAASTYETKANAITGLSGSGKTITYTKGSGTTGTITVDNVSNASNATKATQDGNGNVIVDTYAKKTNGIYYVVGTGTTDGTWLGSSDDITEYYDGLTIAYKLNIAGASTTTLNINGLGAKTVYLRGTTKLTTQYAVDTVIIAVYTTVDGTGRWYVNDYDANSYAYVRQYTTTTAAEYPILFAYETSLPSSYDTKYTRKATEFTYNPSTKFLTVPVDGTTGGFKTANALFSENNNGIPFIGSYNGTRAIAIGIDNTYTDGDYQTYIFPDKDGTVALTSDVPNWWRASANLRGTNNSNKTITYSNTLYSFANGNVASSSNMPKAGDFIIDTYGSIYVVVSATTTNCTATQRWMSTAPWTCLEEGTLITLSDGTQKTIENIRQGDLILGYDFEKNKTTEAVALVCTATVEQDNTNYLVFSNGEYLSCTTDHEIYSSTHKKYMFIKDLKEGDKTLNEKGEETEIYSIHRGIYSMGYKRFYQLVSSNNTYYANNILNAMHPINKFNWLSYSAQQAISQEIMDIFKADAEEFSCYEFLVKDKDFLKQSVSYQSNIKTRQNKIAELKNRLLETDYIAIKKSEGLEVDEAIIIERQKARDEINKLEEEINTIYQPAYNNLLVSHSTIGEDILLSNEEKRSKYFFKACKRDNENIETFKKYYCNK